MRRSWSSNAEETLRELYAVLPMPALAFRLKRTEKAVRSRAKILGLRRGDRRPWTKREDAVLRRRFPKETAAAIARDLARGVSGVYARAHALGLQKPDDWASACTRNRWQQGRHENSRRHQFRKGLIPWNKGTKGLVGVQEACRRTQFKKGRPAHESPNYLPIGTERIAKDGYRERKVTDDPALVPARRWVGVHRLLWEEHLGPVPPGFKVVFKNGDKSDIRIDNLALVTAAEVMRRNSYHNYPEPVRKLIQLRGALNRQINRRTQHGE